MGTLPLPPTPERDCVPGPGKGKGKGRGGGGRARKSLGGLTMMSTTKQEFEDTKLFVAPLETSEEAADESLVSDISPRQLTLNRAAASGILNAHKLHIEDLMEILRMEMRVFADFEKGLDSVTEDDISDYKELIGECLNQRIEVIEGLKAKLS